MLHPFNIPYFTVQHSRNKLNGIMSFEIARPVCKNTISRRMTLIKTITGKFGHKFKNPCCQGIMHSLLNSALNKISLVFLHDFRFLFSHRLAQIICLGKREPAHHLGNLHHLLLIDNNAISLF